MGVEMEAGTCKIIVDQQGYKNYLIFFFSGSDFTGFYAEVSTILQNKSLPVNPIY